MTNHIDGNKVADGTRQNYTLPADAPEERLLQRIEELNADPTVHGILV